MYHYDVDKPSEQTTIIAAKEDPKDTDTKNAEDPKGEKVEQDFITVPLAVMRSGWFNEADYNLWADYWFNGRAYTQEYVIQTCANTQLMMSKAGLRVPICLGHPEAYGGLSNDQGQGAEGWANNFRIKELEEKDQYGEPQVAIFADCTLGGSLKKMYEKGELPSRSPGWCQLGGKLPDGRAVGMHLNHVALLGREQPAQPIISDMVASKQGDSMLAALQTGLKSIASSIKDLFTSKTKRNAANANASSAGNDYAANAKDKECAMTQEEKDQLLVAAEHLNAVIEILTVFTSAEADEPGAETEETETEEGAETANAGDTEMEEENASAKIASAKQVASAKVRTPAEIQLQAKLDAANKQLAKQAKANIENKFNELLNATPPRIAAGAKTGFIEIATKISLERAIETFAGDIPQPSGSIQLAGAAKASQQIAANASELAAKAAEIEDLKDMIASAESDGYTETRSYKANVARLAELTKTA